MTIGIDLDHGHTYIMKPSEGVEGHSPSVAEDCETFKPRSRLRETQLAARITDTVRYDKVLSVHCHAQAVACEYTDAIANCQRRKWRGTLVPHTDGPPLTGVLSVCHAPGPSATDAGALSLSSLVFLKRIHEPAMVSRLAYRSNLGTKE